MLLSKDASETLLKTIQALALLIGGCWVAFRYLDHEREAERLARAQQTLSNQQMARLASTQFDIEKAKARQLELANEQARLAATVQSEQQTLSVQHQRLAVDEARLKLETTLSQTELRSRELAANVRLQELEAAKRQNEISYSGQYRFERLHKLTGRKLHDVGNGLAEYELTYSFSITNRSTTIFDVSFYVIDLYVGRARHNDVATHVSRMNIPNLRNPTMKPRASDAFEWQHVDAIGGIYQAIESSYGSVLRPSWSYSPPVELKLNALGLGHLNNGESAWNTETYILTAPTDGYVTAFIAYCFNSCVSETEGFTGSNVLALRDAKDESPIPSGSDVASTRTDSRS